MYRIVNKLKIYSYISVPIRLNSGHLKQVDKLRVYGEYSLNKSN